MKDWNAAPILSARNLTRRYGEHIGCRDVSFDLWPGEVLGIVGESGSGKSTLLNMLSGRMEPTSGTIAYRDAAGRERNIHALPEGEKRRLLRSELGFVHQRPSDGLRMQVSAGANIGERLMAEGARHYGTLRGRALQWLERVEIDAGRIDDKPALYSGGMQQRLQIARNLVTSPRLVFMDEPTGGLDVSVQARLLDLLRHLVLDMDLAVILVTHDPRDAKPTISPWPACSRTGSWSCTGGRSWKRGSPIRCSTIRITPTRNSSSLPSCKGKP